VEVNEPTTVDVLAVYVAGELEHLEEQDRLLRDGEHEGVHQLRVASRRIRSALATYRPILDRDVSDPLREELKWFGGTLTNARDAQVQRKRLDTLVEGEEDVLVLGPVRARIDDELRSLFQTELSRGLDVLDSERYSRLLDALEAFVVDPPVTEDAAQPARVTLPGLLRRDLKRLRRRHRAVHSAPDVHARDEALHDVRKAAKRLRYAAEGATPVLGGRSTRLAAKAEAVQDLLGELQDTVVSRTMLRQLGVTAHLSGENGFTFGRLHALQQAQAEAQIEQYAATYAALPRPRKVARWG